MNNAKKILAIAAVATLLPLHACNEPVAPPSTESRSIEPISETAQPTSDAAQPTSEAAATAGKDVDLAKHTFAISPQQALDLSAGETGEGIIYKIELDHSDHHGAWLYQVKTLKGTTKHKLKINAETGQIVEKKTDSTDDQKQAINFTQMPLDEAMNLALQKFNGRVEEWKLEYDDGEMYYEFDIDNGTDDQEIRVYVVSKQVVED